MSKNRPRASVFSAIEASTKISKTLSSVTTSEVSRQARESSCARPKGRNRATNSDAITTCFSPSPNFASASPAPEYSVSGPSCNSCSASATSKGIFPISMKQAKPQASNASTVVSGEFQPVASVLLIISICVESAISANTSSERMSMGSTRMPSVNSRLAPTPANGLPVSSPERAKKK